MSTLRDKINQAVDAAGNCRSLSYAALDLLEDLFEKELHAWMSSGTKRKTPEQVYVVSFSSTGRGSHPTIDVYATRDAASRAVIREARGLADVCGLPFDVTDLQIKRILRNGYYSMVIQGARYSWNVESTTVKVR